MRKSIELIVIISIKIGGTVDHLCLNFHFISNRIGRTDSYEILSIFRIIIFTIDYLFSEIRKRYFDIKRLNIALLIK